ncbi:hypothetical protein [Brevibacterium casei]|uniref:HTH cro/C1-type domain-containing protein n=1 Tax=Brevibacterium casei TaxID=33889 RepID=A0AB34XR89_9MICO|nr:hypothetical protein [Brevibacterium casei]KZE19124.1 hypothetical protein AVW13_11750 [Brevibacterium casei]
MVVIEGRFDVKLLSAELFAQLMEHNGFTVRSLADAATIQLRKARSRAVCKRGTVGNLRSGYRDTCRPEVAKALAKCLNVPVEALFATKVSNVQREVGGRAA